MNEADKTLNAIEEYKAGVSWPDKGALSGVPASDVKTFGMPNDDEWFSGPQQQPAPSLPGAQSGGSSMPLSQADGQQAGGGGADLLRSRGTPSEFLQATPAPKVYSVAIESMSAVASTGKTKQIPYEKREKQKVNKQIEATTGQPVRKTIEQLQQQELEKLEAAHKAGEITKRQYKGLKEGWKNIFNVIPEEDFGLFMMDFGLRLMAAGGSGNMTTGEAIGVAGMGALQGVQGRQAAQQAGAVARQEKAAELGIKAYGEETDRLRAEQYGAGYQGEKVWLEQFFKKAGWSDKQIADYFGKAKGEQARRQDLKDAILKIVAGAGYMDKDPVLNKPYREYTQDDYDRWVDAMIDKEFPEEGSGGALSSVETSPKQASDYLSQAASKP